MVDVRSRHAQITNKGSTTSSTHNHLVDQLHSMLCSWYPQTENVDSQKWSKFAKDYELIPGMQDPMRVAQVDLAMRRQFKKKDGTYDRGGKMNKQQLRQALTEVAFTKFPVFVDPDKNGRAIWRKAGVAVKKLGGSRRPRDAGSEIVVGEGRFVVG